MARAASKPKKEISMEEALWKSADKLRGSVEPAEYKHVVLSLFFLKFASDKFEAQRKAISEKYGEKFVDNVAFYTKDNVFFLPEISRWSFIMENAKQDDIALKIDTALYTIEKANPALKGALPDNYYSRLHIDTAKLASLLDEIDKINTGDKENDIIGRIYEYFLSKFALAEGKGKGEFYTPKCIVNLIAEIIEPYDGMLPYLNNAQLKQLQGVLEGALSGIELSHSAGMIESEKVDTVACFINAKRIEGCSEKTLSYYRQTIASMLSGIEKEPQEIVTEDLRKYLTEYQASRKSSKVTIDNIRRILSSYFSWLEDEDYIVKSPVRRIHKVKTAKVIKETYTDEALEIMRDNCCNVRDLAMIDLLASSGMRVGEMVVLNRDDINFNERECVVFGKGSKERIVYFDARTKIHLQNYLESRTDTCSALFVSLTSPHDRLQIGGVERRLRELGKRLNLPRVHPHKFRRTLATSAIDKGMPIEQVQQLLGHQKIDTTMHYAMVKQQNVKLAHRKYIG